MHRVDRAGAGAGRHGRQEAAAGGAEADLLALHVAERLVDRRPGSSGLAPASAAIATTAPTTKTAAIAAKIAQPWRRSPAMRPNVAVSANGMTRMRSFSSQFVSGVGFSNGWAELALTKPPPLVPSSLIASCDGDRPEGDRLRGALEGGHALPARRSGLRDALPDEDERRDERDRQQDVQHGARQVDPEVADRRSTRRRTMPRISAIAIAMPTAADDEVADGRARAPGVRCDHRDLARVVLPVRVGVEADRGVEGEVPGTAGAPVGLSGRTAWRRWSTYSQRDRHEAEHEQRPRRSPSSPARVPDRCRTRGRSPRSTGRGPATGRSARPRARGPCSGRGTA